MSTVLVTGANGFVGGHVVSQLLEKNHVVVGSVRSDEKAGQTKLWFGKGFHPVVVDSGSSFSKVFDQFPEIEAVYHVAAPFDMTVADFKKDVLQDGDRLTSDLFDVLGSQKNVKVVVNVSSVAAHVTEAEMGDSSVTVSGDSWCSYTLEDASQGFFPAYHYNKARAEKSFWDFIKAHPDVRGNSVSPTFIFGPQVVDWLAGRDALNTSADIFRNFLFAGPDGGDKIFPLQGGEVDVRDVARAVITAGANDAIRDQRLLLAPYQFTVPQLINITRSQFPDVAPHLVPEAESQYQSLQFDTANTEKVLGFKFIPLETTVHDAVSQIVEQHPDRFK